jgi:hypothetical protein
MVLCDPLLLLLLLPLLWLKRESLREGGEREGGIDGEIFGRLRSDIVNENMSLT